LKAWVARATRISAIAIIAMAADDFACAQTRQFDIPSGDAGKSIPELARQAGVPVIGPGDTLHGVITPEVKGTYDVIDVLEMMLKGTDLNVSRTAGGVITISFPPKRNVCNDEGETMISTSKLKATASWLATLFAVLQCAAAQGADDNTVETVVVTGLRASLISAQALKASSDSIMDAVVAEDIGKFPDNTAAETLARISGVSIVRYNDEATGFLVRGLPQVTTQINGREVFTDQGRNSQVDFFGAATLAGVEVYKSGTPDLIEPGIGGAVNLRTRRPFDFPDFKFATEARFSYNDQTGQTDPNGHILISDRWNTKIGEIGALFNVHIGVDHYNNAQRFNDSVQRTPQKVTFGSDNSWEVQSVTASGVGNNFYYPTGVGIYYSNGERIRPSANAALQWRPNDKIELYFDGLWQAYRNYLTGDNYYAGISGYNGVISSATLSASQPELASSLTSYEGDNLPNGTRTYWNQKTDTFQGAFGAIWDPVDNLHITSDLAYTYSWYRETSQQVKTRFNSAQTIDVAFDDNGGPTFNFENFDASNASNYKFAGYWEWRFRTTGQGLQWRTDADLKTGWKIFYDIKSGVRYSARNSTWKSGERYADLWNANSATTTDSPNGFDNSLADSPIANNLEMVKNSFRDKSGFQSWLMPTVEAMKNNRQAIVDYVIAGMQQEKAAWNTTGYDSSIALFQSDTIPYKPSWGFGAYEQIFAGYVEGKYNFTVAGLDVNGVVGARASDTVGSYSGFVQVTDSSGNVSYVPRTVHKNYGKITPVATAKVSVAQDLFLRFAYTHSFTRPDFYDLRPSFNVTLNTSGTSSNNAYASGGNPDLHPLTSRNYDIALEWYPKPGANITGALFYREVDGFVNYYSHSIQDATYGTMTITRPENSGKGKIQGFEFNAQSFFDFLPGAFKSFGAQVNTTFLDASNKMPAVLGQNETVPILGVSKWTYNASIFYEKGRYSTRLSYNYRSGWTTGYNEMWNETQYYRYGARPTSRLDFGASYSPLQDFAINFDANNLLAQPYKEYRMFGTNVVPRFTTEEGRYFSLSLRYQL
jgi:iron complex outermembrane recepter protein